MSAALAIAEPAHPRVASLTSGTVAAIVPQTFDDVYRFSQVLARSGLCPYGMDTPEKVSVAILTGLEIGVKPMQAIQGIAVIGGRPSVWGDLALGIVRSSPVFEWIKETYVGTPPKNWAKPEGDELLFKAVCRVKRRDEPEAEPQEFSIADAIQAELWMKRGSRGPTPWVTNPKRMLKMRARGFQLRDNFADVLKGLMVAEEMIGTEDDDGDRTVVRRSAPPPAPALPAVETAKIEHQKAEPTVGEPVGEAQEAGTVDAPTPLREAAPASDPIEDALLDPAPTMDELLADLEDRLSFATSAEEVEEAYTDFDAEAELAPFNGGVEAARAAKEKALAKFAQAEPAQPADPFDIPESFADADGYAAWLSKAIKATTAETAGRLSAAWNGSKEQRANIILPKSRGDAMREAVMARINEFKPQADGPAAQEPPQSEPAPAREPAASEIDLDRPAGSWAEFAAQAAHALKTLGGIGAWGWWQKHATLIDGFDPQPTAEEKRSAKMAIVSAKNQEEFDRENGA